MICKNEKSVQALKHYVCYSTPKVNVDLRNGIDNDEVQELDKLFLPIEMPMRVFRGMPVVDLRIQDGIYCDKAFLSTSSSADDALRFAPRSDGVLLVIDLPQDTLAIPVEKYYPDCNGEDEYIMQRSACLLFDREEIWENGRGVRLDEILQAEIYDNYSDLNNLRILFFRFVMTVEEYLQRDFPFYHITPHSNLSSILKDGCLKAGLNGICVVRTCKEAIIDEIICRQINTTSGDSFSIIRLSPIEKKITLEEVCEDSVSERTAPLHNYILRSRIEIVETDVYKEEYMPKCMSPEPIPDEEIVALTGYVHPALPSRSDDIDNALKEWS